MTTMKKDQAEFGNIYVVLLYTLVEPKTGRRVGPLSPNGDT